MNFKEISLFASLDDETLEYLGTTAKKRELEAYKILFYAGEQPKRFLILASGEVEVYKHDKKGNEIIMGQFIAPSLIAEMPTLKGIPYPATARCKSDVEMYEIDFESIQDYISKTSSLSQIFISSLTQKIQHLESVLRYATISNASARAATFLIDNEHQLHQITQRQIASNIMLTPEGLSRILKCFKKDGLIEVRVKKLYIVDRERLLKIAN
ncbi:MAG: Crp/Fnr family transcriptional regulator [Sulfurovaceae bacterium]|nr:Crp/Fnr family transcriptional regulator [Sulfurovaceae bacterium]